MNCIRIKFILPIDISLEFSGKNIITLKLPEQDIPFDVSVIENKIYRTYTLKSKPLNIEIEDSTISKIQDSLYLSSFDVQSGIILNPNLGCGGISNSEKNRFKKVGIKLESDFIGVSLVDCETKFISVGATASVGINSSNFENAINTKIIEHNFSDNKLLRAMELYNSTSYMSRVNNSGRFVLLMSAIECIINQKKVSKGIISILNRAKKEINELSISDIEKKSVQGSLDFVKNESIKRSGKSLIQELFSDSNIKYNGYSPPDFFSKAYDLRSNLVHDGKTETKFLSIENSQLQTFTHECLKRYYEKSIKKKSIKI